jgi:hypothetical protein
MLFKEIIPVYCGNLTEPTSSLHNAALMTGKADDICRNCSALDGLKSVDDV